MMIERSEWSNSRKEEISQPPFVCSHSNRAERDLVQASLSLLDSIRCVFFSVCSSLSVLLQLYSILLDTIAFCSNFESIFERWWRSRERRLPQFGSHAALNHAVRCASASKRFRTAPNDGDRAWGQFSLVQFSSVRQVHNWIMKRESNRREAFVCRPQIVRLCVCNCRSAKMSEDERRWAKMRRHSAGETESVG